MSEILLIRPGSSDFDDQHRLQGTLNLPLNERGRSQVDEIVNAIGSDALEILFVGPSDPAQATAEMLQDRIGVKIKVAAEWSNLRLGLWEGLSVEEVRRKNPKVFKQWIEAPETICPPEGETVNEAIERIWKVLNKAIRKRACFGIVASEPLATLIHCTLLCEKPYLPHSFGGQRNELAADVGLVERIHCDRLGDPGNCLKRGPNNESSVLTSGKRGTAE